MLFRSSAGGGCGPSQQQLVQQLGTPHNPTTRFVVDAYTVGGCMQGPPLEIARVYGDNGYFFAIMISMGGPPNGPLFFVTEVNQSTTYPAAGQVKLVPNQFEHLTLVLDFKNSIGTLSSSEGTSAPFVLHPTAGAQNGTATPELDLGINATQANGSSCDMYYDDVVFDTPAVCQCNVPSRRGSAPAPPAQGCSVSRSSSRRRPRSPRRPRSTPPPPTRSTRTASR